MLKKLLASSTISFLALTGVALAEGDNSKGVSTTSTTVVSTTGNPVADVEKQIKVLRQELESKIKALRLEYEAKFKALREAAKAKRDALRKEKEEKRKTELDKKKAELDKRKSELENRKNRIGTTTKTDND